MWQRINQQSPLLASAPIVNPRNITLAAGESITSFQFTPIELRSVQPAEGIPIPAPAITPEKDPNIPFEVTELEEVQIESYLRKIRNFDAIFASDIYLDPRYEPLLLRTTQHLTRVERYIGHGNFNLMSFDEMLQHGRDFSQIGKFEADELNFIEEVFFANPHRYGFFGKKISAEITDLYPA